MKGQRMYRRLTLAELGAWQVQRPNALLLDARDADSHARSGWPGSVCLSRHNQDDLLLHTSRRRPVLIYCHHGNASQTWAQMFADFGFTDVCDLVGGHAAWVAATANPSGKTPTPELAAWLACVNGNLQGVERLVEAGVPISHAHTTGATCLMYAASSGKTEVLRTQDNFSAPDMAANLDGLQLLRRSDE